MIICNGQPMANDHMPEDILVDLAGIVRNHPWWRARARLTLGLLQDLGINPPVRILDAGCGWGLTLEALERRGYGVVGMDISRRTLERLDGPSRELVWADLAGPVDVDLGLFDAVLSLDVLEHIDDDNATVVR